MPDQSPEPITLFEGQLTTTPTNVYTAPAGASSIEGIVTTVESATLVNITSSFATVRIDHVPAGGSDATTEEVFSESIAANSTVNLPLNGPGPVVVLQPGDSLWVSAGAATAIDCSVIGSESPIE